MERLLSALFNHEQLFIFTVVDFSTSRSCLLIPFPVFADGSGHSSPGGEYSGHVRSVRSLLIASISFCFSHMYPGS